MTVQSLKLLGQLFKMARNDRHLTQRNLAERLGVDRQTVIAMEAGKPTVSAGVFFEAAHILGVPLMASDKAEFKRWSTLLPNFEAIIPKRVLDKKIELDDDF